MELIEKVKAVEGVFLELDKAISSFQSATTLHCKFGCGKCCFKADIEASPLEFLPFAYSLYKQGIAIPWLERISTDGQICMFLNPNQAGAGLCTEYAYRGLICRLFGYSARTNKYSQKELVTCQVIKTEQKDAYEGAQRFVSEGGAVPVMSQYYMQLHSIDPELARELCPINKAIRRAVEIVLHYFAYREESPQTTVDSPQ